MSERFLAGRVAMVTGGASGMGKAMALAFAGAGAEVAIGSLLAGGAKAAGEVAYLPGADELEQARSEIEALGVHCLASGLDVADDGSAQDRMIKHVLSGMIEGKWGRIINIASTAGAGARPSRSRRQPQQSSRAVPGPGPLRRGRAAVQAIPSDRGEGARAGASRSRD